MADFKKITRKIKKNGEWLLSSFWTHASTVVFDDGKTLEEKVNEIEYKIEDIKTNGADTADYAKTCGTAGVSADADKLGGKNISSYGSALYYDDTTKKLSLISADGTKSDCIINGGDATNVNGFKMCCGYFESLQEGEFYIYFTDANGNPFSFSDTNYTILIEHDGYNDTGGDGHNINEHIREYADDIERTTSYVHMYSDGEVTDDICWAAIGI